jgi:hypothetical protein
MPLAINAIWFAATRTVLLSRNSAGTPAIICDCKPIDQLGPRASATRRRYWTLPDEGIAKLVAVDVDARYQLFVGADELTLSLLLDPGRIGSENQLLVAYRPASQVALRLAFLAQETDVADASELHRRVRDGLGLGQHDYVNAIWSSAIVQDDNGLHIGPARLCWPCGSLRSIAIHQPSSVGLKSELELSAHADHYVVETESGSSIVRLSLSDPDAAVLLVWRSVFAGRLNRIGPNDFLLELQRNIAHYLNWWIPFSSLPPAPGGSERPIVRGYLRSPSGAEPDPIAPGQPVTLKFSGPLDIDDVMMLCIHGKPIEQVAIVQQQPGAQLPHVPEAGQQIICWRMTIEGLMPIAWEAIEPKIGSELMARLQAERRWTGNRLAIVSGFAPGEGEERVRSSVPRAALIEPASLFCVGDKLSGILDEWFATVDPTTVARLCKNATEKPIAFANIAKFLPIAIDSLLDVSVNWSVFERDAESLHKETVALQYTLDPPAELPHGHVRGDPKFWRLIEQVLSEQQSFDQTQLRLVSDLLPTESGALPCLDPSKLHQITDLLGKFAQSRSKPLTDLKLADTAVDTRGA